MAIFKGGKGRDDSFTGGSKADRFEFDPLDLNSGDTIVGGSGRAIDVLKFTAPGAIGISTLAHVSGIERIELANGAANSLVLTNDFVESANGGRVQVVGGDGDDFIYASDLYDGSAIDFVSNGGTDYVFGGESDDTFTFDITTLDASDRVFGDAGANTLILSGSGSVAANQLYGMANIGTIALGDGGVSIAITDSLLYAAGDASLTVVGGAGADVIDARATTVFGNREAFSGGGGDDVITVGAGSYYTAAVDGGTGSDTIRGGVAAVVYDRDDVSVTVAQGTLILRGAATIDLTRTDDQSLDDVNVVTGIVSVSATESKAAVNLTGGTGTRLIGGAGKDVLTGASYMQGGKGADTMIGSAEGTYFTLADHEFARGETIRASGARDSLVITGENDIRNGTVTGIENLVCGDYGLFGSTGGILHANASQLKGVTSVYATSSQSTLDITMARGDVLLPNLQSGNYFSFIDVTGSAGADLIQVPGVRNVHAGSGNDTIQGVGTIYGEAGNDIVTTSGVADRTVDGGEGSDTLILIGDYFGTDQVTINLARRGDQLSLGDDVADAKVLNFENVDVSRIDEFYAPKFSINGDVGANILIGGVSQNAIFGMDGDDRIVGGQGDDVLSGGNGQDVLYDSRGHNVMSGGDGADAFRFTEQTHIYYFIETEGTAIKDFDVSADRLEFDRDTFEVAGRAFDTRIVSDGTGSVGAADLVVATGTRLADYSDVQRFLLGLDASKQDHGLFVAGVNGRGETMLFYASTTHPADYQIDEVANLGKIGDPTQALTLDVFGFI